MVNRGADVKFWHLTFQEFLAARLLAKMDAAERHSLLFAEGRAWLPEWREVVLLLAGILHQDRAENVNALVAAALDDLYGSTLAKRKFHWVGAKPKLAEQARCFGLLGAMLRDLQPLGYTPPDPRYAEVKNAVLGIFEANQAAAIPSKTRLAAAEALGQAGDPRLRLPRDPDYWVRVEGFEIGKYPVTAQEYQLFVDDGGSQAGEMGQPVTTAQLSGREYNLVRRESVLRLGARAVADRGRMGTGRAGPGGARVSVGQPGARSRPGELQ